MPAASNTHHVYLAGPITGCGYGECTDWREDVAAEINALSMHDVRIVCLSPMRGKGYLAGLSSMPLSASQHVLSTPHAIVARDTFDIDRSDVVLVNLVGAKTVSIGTVAEIGYAKAKSKLIVAALEDSGNVHDHPFVREMSNVVVPSLDQAVGVVLAMLQAKPSEYVMRLAAGEVKVAA